MGSVAALAYSRKIVETLTTIVPYALGLVLLPFSSELAARRDTEGLARLLTSDMRLSMILPWRISVFTDNGATKIGLIRPTSVVTACGQAAKLFTEIEATLIRIIDDTR